MAKAAPDGYTLLMGAVHHTIATSVYKKLSYDFQKSFAPITTVALVPNVLAVSATTPAKDVKELVALIKAAPDKFSYGSNGAGTAQHLIGTQFSTTIGQPVLHVPYKGSGPLTTDLLGGQVSMSFDTITPVLPHIKAGKLRALAVTTAQRSAMLPEVPPMAETLPGFEVDTWWGLIAPAGTPAETVRKLNSAFTAALGTPEVKAQFARLLAEPAPSTPQAFEAFLQKERGKYERMVKLSGAQVD